MWLYVALYYSNRLKINRSYHWRLSTIRVGMPSRRRPLMNRMHSTDIVVNCAKYVLQLLRSFIPPVTTEYDPGAQRWHASELLAPVVIQDFHIFDMTCLTVDVKYRFLDCTSLACSYRTQTENSHLQTESITIGPLRCTFTGFTSRHPISAILKRKIQKNVRVRHISVWYGLPGDDKTVAATEVKTLLQVSKKFTILQTGHTLVFEGQVT